MADLRALLQTKLVAKRSKNIETEVACSIIHCEELTYLTLQEDCHLYRQIALYLGGDDSEQK